MYVYVYVCVQCKYILYLSSYIHLFSILYFFPISTAKCANIRKDKQNASNSKYET